jgi:hypothetical protein
MKEGLLSQCVINKELITPGEHVGHGKSMLLGVLAQQVTGITNHSDKLVVEELLY